MRDKSETLNVVLKYEKRTICMNSRPYLDWQVRPRIVRERDWFEVMKIQKRDGRVVPYEAEKIVAAIGKANNEVEEKERASEEIIAEILSDVEKLHMDRLTVESIQDMIEADLVKHNKYTLAKKYIVYR